MMAPSPSMALLRRDDWDQRLMAVIVEHQAVGFAYGRADCATLFADVVEAVTGVDPLAEHRGRWKSERGALRVLASTGADSVAAWVAARFKEIEPVDARRGDVGYPADAHELGFPAVVVGATAMSRDESRWLVIPRRRLVRCFQVG